MEHHGHSATGPGSRRRRSARRDRVGTARAAAFADAIRSGWCHHQCDPRPSRERANARRMSDMGGNVVAHAATSHYGRDGLELCPMATAGAFDPCPRNAGPRGSRRHGLRRPRICRPQQLHHDVPPRLWRLAGPLLSRAGSLQPHFPTPPRLPRHRSALDVA